MAARFERDLSLHLSVQKKLQLFDRSEEQMEGMWAVSYTHLTLPTICSV